MVEGKTLNIKNPRTYRLARELADRTGESLTDAVTRALEDRLHALVPEDSPGQRLERLVLRLKDEWKEPWKSTPHGDLLYDEMGLPK